MDHPEDDAGSNAGDGRPENSGGTSGTGSGKAQGKDLSTLDAAPIDLAQLFERAEERAAGEGRRGRFQPLLNFASNAAFVAGVLGFAFAAGTYFFGGNMPGKGMKTAAVVSQEGAERAEMLRTTQKMVEDIRELKANVDALRSSVAQNSSAKDQHGLEKSVEALKTRLDAAKAETSGVLAELSNKVDHMQHDPALKQVVERLDRIEKQTAAPLSTSSAAPMVKAATQGRPDVAQAKSPADSASPPKQRLALITDWVVRDVYDGVALVENARGSLEVALGETIPGAGTVKAIERRGPGWIVITSRGLVDYDHGNMFPMN
jgi:hypothetical protein